MGGRTAGLGAASTSPGHREGLPGQAVRSWAGVSNGCWGFPTVDKTAGTPAASVALGRCPQGAGAQSHPAEEQVQQVEAIRGPAALV